MTKKKLIDNLDDIASKLKNYICDPNFIDKYQLLFMDALPASEQWRDYINHYVFSSEENALYYFNRLGQPQKLLIDDKMELTDVINELQSDELNYINLAYRELEPLLERLNVAHRPPKTLSTILNEVSEDYKKGRYKLLGNRRRKSEIEQYIAKIHDQQHDLTVGMRVVRDFINHEEGKWYQNSANSQLLIKLLQELQQMYSDIYEEENENSLFQFIHNGAESDELPGRFPDLLSRYIDGVFRDMQGQADLAQKKKVQQAKKEQEMKEKGPDIHKLKPEQLNLESATDEEKNKKLKKIRDKNMPSEGEIVEGKVHSGGLKLLEEGLGDVFNQHAHGVHKERKAFNTILKGANMPTSDELADVNIAERQKELIKLGLFAGAKQVTGSSGNHHEEGGLSQTVGINK